MKEAWRESENRQNMNYLMQLVLKDHQKWMESAGTDDFGNLTVTLSG